MTLKRTHNIQLLKIKNTKILIKKLINKLTVYKRNFSLLIFKILFSISQTTTGNGFLKRGVSNQCAARVFQV